MTKVFINFILKFNIVVISYFDGKIPKTFGMKNEINLCTAYDTKSNVLIYKYISNG